MEKVSDAEKPWAETSGYTAAKQQPKTKDTYLLAHGRGSIIWLASSFALVARFGLPRRG